MSDLGPTVDTRLHELLGRCAFPPPATPLDCAVSGGADSLALLVLGLAAGCAVHADHVDHGLRLGSSAETAIVKAAADRFGAGFTAHSLELEAGPNLEARARSARQRVLPSGAATGHTADDQAETVLLGLIRGSAWRGLGGMTPSAEHPILRLRRSETEEVCMLVGLEPVCDPTNRDPSHRRNRVRHELLPLLTDIADRDLVPVLERQAELFRQGGELLDELSGQLDATDARQLATAPVVLARAAIRQWLWQERGDEHPPDLATVDRVLDVARLRATATDVGRGWRVTWHRAATPPDRSRP